MYNENNKSNCDKISRSNKYQYLLKEIAYEDKCLDRFSNTQSTSGLLNPFKYNEDLLKLQDQLIARVWEVIDTQLTDTQREILNMYYKQGMTQKEIAAIRQCNQTSVTKSMIGNNSYDEGMKYGKTYGGALPKLKSILLKDPIYLNILKQIEEIKEEI